MGCLKSKCHQLGVVAIGFVPRFFRLSVPAVLGGVVAEVRTGQNTKKNWHSLREVRTVGERGLCRRRPMVVLDGFRQVGHHEILLNAMLKIEQR